MSSQTTSLIHQAVRHLQAGNMTMAEALLRDALQADPLNFNGLHTLGAIYAMQRQYEAAVALFNKAIEVNPNSGVAHFNLAAALAGSGNDLASLPHHAKAVQLAPGDADVWVNYGSSLSRMDRSEEALKCYEQALEINPRHIEALSNQGALFAQLGRHDAALSSLGRALALNPSQAAAWSNMGIALRELKRYDEALTHFDRAIRLSPSHAATWSNKGNTLGSLRRYEEALTHYDQALHLDSGYADAWYNKAYTLANLKRFDEALAHYDRAIQIEPENVDTWYKKSIALNELKRYEAALQCYDRAVELNPDLDFLYGDRLSAMMSVCYWLNVEPQFSELAEKIRAGIVAATPFTLLSLLDSPALHRQVASLYAKNFPADFSLGAIEKRPAREKIRVGYFSHDFHNHATAFLTAELFELHDRSKFEITGFCFGPDRNDPMRHRLLSAFDQFIDVRSKSDKEIAQLARELEIDIAVDLQGYQTQHRPGIFACRAAPIQVNYLAYPGTMSAEYMDYIVADHTLVVPESQQYYSEKLVNLPNAYQPNDQQRIIADRRFSREELGLPRSGFVFCCFNTNYKITPQTFDGWMRILKQVDDSVLWLYEGSAEAVRNLRNEAVARGVSADRLIFAGYMNLPDHLARHRAADLFLDTFPYSAHTTASDALWAGLPVLTKIGASFPSRVAASLLNAVHLPELIAQSQEEYERMAVEFAKHPDGLAELKQKLAVNLRTTPLFDTPLYTRHLEAAYSAMVERYQADLPPEQIFVAG